MNRLPSPFESDVTSSGTGSAECLFSVHGVAWSQDTPRRMSPTLSATEAKKSLSIDSMFFFFPLASPSWPNSSGPLMWTYTTVPSPSSDEKSLSVYLMSWRSFMDTIFMPRSFAMPTSAGISTRAVPFIPYFSS